MEASSIPFWIKRPDSDSEYVESETFIEDAIKEEEVSTSNGFVILTSISSVSHGEEKKDAQVVSEWFSGRLNRMNISPIILSFDDPAPEIESAKEEVIPVSKAKNHTTEESGNDSSTFTKWPRCKKGGPVTDSEAIYGLDGDPIVSSKIKGNRTGIRQRLERELELAHLKTYPQTVTFIEDNVKVTDKSDNETDKSGSDNVKRSTLENTGENSFQNLFTKKKVKKFKKKPKKGNGKSKKKSQKSDTLSILEEKFQTLSSQDDVWVIIIDTPFSSGTDMGKVEAMREKYNFQILTLNPPFKSNILTMLGKIAEQKEKVSKQKCFTDDTVPSAERINDFNHNCVDYERDQIVMASVMEYNRSYQESLNTVNGDLQPFDYEHRHEAKQSHIVPVSTDPETDDDDIENENVADRDQVQHQNQTSDNSGNTRDDITVLLSQDTLKSSISSPSMKFLETKFGRLCNGVLEDGSRTNNEIGSNVSFDEEEDSSGDSKNSSVFEMGEKNLFMCVKQASKIVIPPPVSPRLFFQNSKNRDSSKTRALVVIIRDLEHERSSNFSLSRALKEKLKRNKIKSYIISISNLMKDLQAIQVMKGYANKISMCNKTLGVTDGYSHLILAVLAEKMIKKSKRVILIDLGDEASLRLWPVKDFCIRSHAEVMTLERLSDEADDSFELKLSKLSNSISKRYKAFDWTAFPFNKEVVTEMSHQNLPTFLQCSPFLDIRQPTATSNKPDDDDECSQTGSEHESGHEVVNVPEFVPKLEEAERLVSDLEKVRERLTRHSDPQMESTLEEKDENDHSEDPYQLSLRKKKKRYNSKGNLNDRPSTKGIDVKGSNHRSLYALRRSFPASNSSVSTVNLNELYTQRPKLLRIQKIPDSKAPSTMFSKVNISKQHSCTDEEYLYKGWVAVPQEPATRVGRVERVMRDTGILMMRIIKPVRSFLTCKYCRNPQEARVAPQQPRQRQNRRGIVIKSEDEFYSNN